MSILAPARPLFSAVWLALAAAACCVPAARSAEVTDEQLYAKAQEAWRESWERFFDARTNLFYDRVCSTEPAKRLQFLPTPEEIARQYPNRNGWGTGMEDCAISGGVMMAMICDRFAATADLGLRPAAQKTFAGLVLLGTLSPSEGFVIRGVHPGDRRSHYCESSRDQYTWHAYGLWRYARSTLSDAAEKAKARDVLAAICRRLERNVVEKNDYHLGREDGTFDGLVDKMWKNDAHEVARLPMIYAMGADLTGDRRWRDLARKFAPEAAQLSIGESTKIPYALLQEQVSLEALYQLEESPELKARWLECMQAVAQRSKKACFYGRDYRPLDLAQLNMDWRSWPLVNSGGYKVPRMPKEGWIEDRTVRQPAEGALSLLLVPQPSLAPDLLGAVKQAIAQVDYTKAITYGLYYTQAVYWRGVRQGVFKLPAKDLSIYPSNEHFWYRPQPGGPYIDAQRDNKAFGYLDGKILLSEDNGRTWPHCAAFPEAQRITFSVILKNGNVLFATGERLYLSTDNLKSYRPITVKDSQGQDYLPHKPQNPGNPGWYFHTLPGINSWQVEGREMLVWGNYCNVLGGATPVNIYYSTDNGQTVKIAYAFGRNPNFRDNGSPGGSKKEGTLLGNPDNPVICRHVHTVAYNPRENAFYACTGDGNRPEGRECHWLRGTYDARQDAWQWKVIVTASLNTRYKSGGITFVDGKVYWISDANGPKPYDRGIFCCEPADIPNPAKHTMLFNPQVESGNMIIQDGVILASHCAPASTMANGIIVSTDMGKTWAQYDLKQFGPRSATRFHEKNSDGWFRLDLRTGWIKQTDVMFIKPKPAKGG
jgi:hypothetical protein